MDTSSFDGVIVVGGGYAGLHAARAAERAGVPSRLIDPSPTHDFITRLSAVAGGTARLDDAGVPFAALERPVTRAVVRRVDDGRVVLDDGSSIDAAAVVIATGSIPTAPPIPGLRHAATLRTAVEAAELRTRIRQADAVVIAGGGATGVQLAGAIAVAHPDVDVTIVDPEPTLLASMAPALGRRAETLLRGRGVDLRLGDSIGQVSSSGTVLRSGSRLDGLVVWAGGFTSAGTALGDHLPLLDGRIEVDPQLRVQGWRRTFAAGDVAAHRGPDGDHLPMSAQIAVQAGTGAGANAARVARRRPTEAVGLRQRGWVLDLGGGRGVADLGGVTLAGPGLDRLAPLLHTAIDAKNLLEIGGVQALRWLPGFARPAEVVHLDLPADADADADAGAVAAPHDIARSA